MKFKRIIITVLCFFICGSIWGENRKEWTRKSLRVVTNDHAIESLYFLNEGKWEALTVLAVKASQPFDYYGPTEIRFYSSPFSREDPVPEPVGIASLMPAAQEQILVFVPSPSEPAWTIHAVASGEQHFPDSYVLFVNKSGVEITGSLGGNVERIKTNGTVLCPFDPKKQRAFHIQLAVFDKEKERWKRTYASGLPGLPNIKWLVLCLPATTDPWLLMIEK